ncbi:YihY/virulence factor BrkB family protein [Cellulomonas shaoxiangyii]|uniref:YihY/virulence factor BrkB family protein n=1 Tax=Cellulomonas shaoxiangyii TaxID=2566013 RepID=A0A4V1CMW2_9CELL|nr:YihY/virulence factor BrkB family protein [Cellulomonas shaoxiangyii]QCB94335.1 YihY/virulence factor BrkB family protein [Cellulomonas shaoxiangyii]TGY82178.1 YihY/virulence factor BrkB family protein [Cellulomonas shaoxiangyii]
MARTRTTPERTVVRPAAGSGEAHVAAAAAAPDPVTAPRWAPGFRGLVARGQALLAWWNHTRAGRTVARFGRTGGAVLSGGIAYAALFSVFAGLALGYTVFMALLGRNAELRATVLDTIASSLPGLLDTGDGKGLLRPDQLELSTGLSVAGLVAVVVLVFTGIRAIAALRTGVQAMFGVYRADTLVVGKLRELGGFVGVGVAVLVTALVGLGVTTAADWLMGLVGWDDRSGIVVRVLGVAVAFVMDATLFVLIVRALAGQAPPRRDLLGGAAIAAAGLGVVRLLGTTAVSGSVQDNPVLASFAVVAVLLLWVNLIARIVLLAAAWTADPPYVDPNAQADEDAAAAAAAAAASAASRPGSRSA